MTKLSITKAKGGWFRESDLAINIDHPAQQI